MSTTKKKSISLKGKNTTKARNPLALNPLMKKSHAHTKSAKSDRAKDKRALKKELQQSDKLDC